MTFIMNLYGKNTNILLSIDANAKTPDFSITDPSADTINHMHFGQ